MDKFVKIINEFRQYSNPPELQLLEDYITTGDGRVLKALAKTGTRMWIWGDIAKAISRPDSLDDNDRRALRALVACSESPTTFLGGLHHVGDWMDRHLSKEAPDVDLFGAGRLELLAAGMKETDLLDFIGTGLSECERKGRPTSLGRYLLALSDKDLRRVIAASSSLGDGVTRFIPFFCSHGLDRLTAVRSELMRPRNDSAIVAICRHLLLGAPAMFEADVANAFRSKRACYERFTIGVYLAGQNFAKYGREVLKVARENLVGSESHTRHDVVAEWMVDSFGSEVIPDLVAYVSRKGGISGHWKPSIIHHSVSRLNAVAMPVVLAGLDTGRDDTRFVALESLVAIDPGEYSALILDRLTDGFRSQDTAVVIKFIGLAGRWRNDDGLNALWTLIEHKSKPVREAAVRTLGRLRDGAVTRATNYLANRKTDIRISAIHLLSSAGTESALRILEEHLDVEQDDAVREAVLSAVQSAWTAQGKTIPREVIEERILKNTSKLRWPPTSWLSDLPLQPIRYATGELVPEPVVRYMIARQAKSQDISPSLELKPLYGIIDRSTSAGLASELLARFLSSGAQAKDRWALAIAALLGDDRIVPALVSRINEWAESSRGKLAEYAVQALALVGTDRALLAVDSMAMRYRTKMKNIGAAASAAFISAAEELGVTPEELGDRVVPWLGFEPGKPRLIDCGGRQIEVRVGLDWKLKLLDLEKNKSISSLPSSAPPEVKAEFKDLSALLREASKSQVLRIETMMVRQYRWPEVRWTELFLGHPIMRPFGARLVWAAYAPSGELAQTFRALEDGTLTDRGDEEITLDGQYSIGIVHPLELDEDAREEWLRHLHDYEVAPPFPQLDRPVVAPSPDQVDVRFCKDFEGTSINGLTFKGRAERLGWRRGSVCDAGSISAYVKSFPSAGVDVFLMLDSMFVGIDMYSDITVQSGFFVKHGSVEIGSYVYDEPNSEDDHRLIQFREVPPIVFSEAIGDLQRITKGRQTEADDE